MDNEKSNQSIVNFAFVCAGFLAWFLTVAIVEVMAGTFAWMARLHNNLAFQNGFPVAVGLVVAGYLFLNKKVQAFADECVVEIRKVVWPSRKDTISMTSVVCFMVLASGIMFGIFDFVSSQLIKIFVNQ